MEQVVEQIAQGGNASGKGPTKGNGGDGGAGVSNCFCTVNQVARAGRWWRMVIASAIHPGGAGGGGGGTGASTRISYPAAGQLGTVNTGGGGGGNSGPATPAGRSKWWIRNSSNKI